MLGILRIVAPRAARRPEVDDELRGLAESASGGNPAALRTLLSALGPRILRTVRRVLGANHPDVEDVAQECAVEFVKALARFRGESSVQYFACRVALRTAMNARRRHRASKRLLPVGDTVEADEVAGRDPGPDMTLASRASARVARELCDELPETQSEVLALHCVLGYTMNEVAEICGAPLETVRSRLRAAKQALVTRAMSDAKLREYLEEPV